MLLVWSPPGWPAVYCHSKLLFPQAADTTLYQPTCKRNQQASERIGLDPSALITLRASECQFAFIKASITGIH